MSTSTTNLGLIKPAGNERPDVDVINDNMDILDAKIGAVGNTDLQSQVNQRVMCQMFSNNQVSLAANSQAVAYVNYSLPSGATFIGCTLGKVPNANWVYCGISEITATYIAVNYRNTYGDVIVGDFQILVFYT